MRLGPLKAGSESESEEKVPYNIVSRWNYGWTSVFIRRIAPSTPSPFSVFVNRRACTESTVLVPKLCAAVLLSHIKCINTNNVIA